MNAKRIVIISVVGGVVIALLTGLVSNTPPMLVGAVWYGYPLAWLIRLVLAPEYFPWRADVPALVADVIVWTIIVAVVISVSTKIWKR